MSDTPDFTTWQRSVLERFAVDVYQRLQQQQETIEQLRQDNKDLSRINRELLTNKDDWK